MKIRIKFYNSSSSRAYGHMDGCMHSWLRVLLSNFSSPQVNWSAWPGIFLLLLLLLFHDLLHRLFTCLFNSARFYTHSILGFRVDHIATVDDDDQQQQQHSIHNIQSRVWRVSKKRAKKMFFLNTKKNKRNCNRKTHIRLTPFHNWSLSRERQGIVNRWNNTNSLATLNPIPAEPQLLSRVFKTVDRLCFHYLHHDQKLKTGQETCRKLCIKTETRYLSLPTIFGWPVTIFNLLFSFFIP